MEENIINDLNTENSEIKSTVDENGKSNAKQCCTSKCDKMYKALNILTFAGVIVLFILYFTNKKANNKVSVSNNGAAYSIAYVNSDSLMSQYKMFDVYKTTMENRKKQMEADMAVKAKKFESDVADYQKKVQSYAISSDQAQKIEADLTKRQQQLLELKDNLTNELSQMELSNQTSLFDSIISALKVYNANQNFDYILGYSKGIGILLANEKYNITPAVVEILNKNYDKNK